MCSPFHLSWAEYEILVKISFFCFSRHKIQHSFKELTWIHVLLLLPPLCLTARNNWKSLERQQDPEYDPATVLLAPHKKRCWEVVQALRHPCSQTSPPNQESESNASVQRWDPVRKYSYWCSRALSKQRPRKPISHDRSGQFYKAAGSLRQYQSRGFDIGGSASYQLVSSEYRGSYIVSRAVTSRPVWYRRFCKAWEVLAFAVGRRGGTLHDNGQGVPTEGRCIPPEGLGRKITHLSPGLEGIHSWHYRLGPS
jgi:hypothetical protein